MHESYIRWLPVPFSCANSATFQYIMRSTLDMRSYIITLTSCDNKRSHSQPTQIKQCQDKCIEKKIWNYSMFLRTPQGDGLAVLILVRLLLHRAQHSRDTNGDQVGRIPLGYPKRCLFFFLLAFYCLYLQSDNCSRTFMRFNCSLTDIYESLHSSLSSQSCEWAGMKHERKISRKSHSGNYISFSHSAVTLIYHVVDNTIFRSINQTSSFNFHSRNSVC